MTRRLVNALDQAEESLIEFPFLEALRAYRTGTEVVHDHFTISDNLEIQPEIPLNRQAVYRVELLFQRMAYIKITHHDSEFDRELNYALNITKKQTIMLLYGPILASLDRAIGELILSGVDEENPGLKELVRAFRSIKRYMQ